MNLLIGLAFAGIFGALIYAGVSMVRDGRSGRPKTKRMANALTWRIGISVALFLIVLISYKFGWITPRGMPLG